MLKEYSNNFSLIVLASLISHPFIFPLFFSGFVSATDGHKVEDFNLQKLAPAGSKACEELWLAGNTGFTWLGIQKS